MSYYPYAAAPMYPGYVAAPVAYGANPYAPTVVAGNAAHAMALDAADGVIDGRSFGANVAAPAYPVGYGRPAGVYGYGVAPVAVAPMAPVYGVPTVHYGVIFK